MPKMPRAVDEPTTASVVGLAEVMPWRPTETSRTLRQETRWKNEKGDCTTRDRSVGWMSRVTGGCFVDKGRVSAEINGWGWSAEIRKGGRAAVVGQM